MSLATHEVKAFLEIAATQNISRAAERLGTSQPALSLVVKRLENYFGVPLFLRTKRGVELTKAGVKLAAESKKILRDLDSLRENILKQETGFQGVYTIGFHPQVASYTFPRFGQELLEKADQLEINLVQGPSRTILAEVVSFNVDFGIVVNPPPHPDLAILPLYRNTVRFWVYGKPTSLQKPLQASAVAIYDRSLPQMESLFFKAQAEKKLLARRTLHSTDLGVIGDFVASGLGIGILPSTIAEKKREDKLVSLPSLPSLDERICLVYRPDFQKSQAAKYIKELILRTCRRG